MKIPNVVIGKRMPEQEMRLIQDASDILARLGRDVYKVVYVPDRESDGLPFSITFIFDVRQP